MTQQTKQAILELRRDGTVAALSSDGGNIYTVRLDPLSCTCRGFTNHGHCYHATQAWERFGRYPVQHRQPAQLRPETVAALRGLYPEAA